MGKKKIAKKSNSQKKLLTISVVFPSCVQMQPTDGQFYTKDEVTP